MKINRVCSIKKTTKSRLYEFAVGAFGLALLTCSGTAFSASLQQVPDIAGTEGFYGDAAQKMVCGNIPSTGLGLGYGFRRFQSGPADVLKAIHYQTTLTGVNSSAASHPDLQRGTYDFSVVGMAPNDPLGRVFVIGGKGSSGFVGEYFKYGSSGFSAPSNTPVPAVPDATTKFAAGLVSGRAGLGASVIDGTNFLLFGGYDAGGMRSEVFSVDVGSSHSSPHTWTAKAPMPIPLKNPRALPSGGSGTISWVYVVGGGTAPGIDNNNRRIFRYNISGPYADQWFAVKDSTGSDLIIPGTRQIEIASVQGTIMVLTQSEDEQSMVAYRVTHPINEVPAGPGMLGAAKGATLTATNFPVPLRSRSGFGLLRCSPDAWVVGGATGHGSTFSNRGKYLDKLRRFP
jgi:hypothetical protein